MDPRDFEVERERMKEKNKEYVKTFSIYIAYIRQTDSESKLAAVIGENVFKCHSLLSAVDTCFKIGFLFDERFPVGAKLIWEFLQHSIYFPMTRMHSCVRRLLMKIKRTKKNPKAKASKPKSAKSKVVKPRTKRPRKLSQN